MEHVPCGMERLTPLQSGHCTEFLIVPRVQSLPGDVWTDSSVGNFRNISPETDHFPVLVGMPVPAICSAV